MKRKLKSRTGLTVIEVMAIIVILSILALIAFPQLASYKRRAFDARSISDLRNAASGEEIYYIENEHYLDCDNTIACEALLPGFKPSKGVNISMSRELDDGEEYFIGASFHPQGVHNTVENAYTWSSNSANSGNSAN